MFHIGTESAMHAIVLDIPRAMKFVIIVEEMRMTADNWEGRDRGKLSGFLESKAVLFGFLDT